MSLWKRISSSPDIEQRMKQYYDEKGLAEIRIYLAQWIEERIMSERIAISNGDLYEHLALQFFEDLKRKLITLSNDNSIKYKLAEICAQTTALDFYNHIRNGLHKEFQLLGDMPQNQYMFAADMLNNGSLIGGSGLGVGVGGIGVSGVVGMGAFYNDSDELAELHRKMRALVESIDLQWQDMQSYMTAHDSLWAVYNNFRQSNLSPQEVESGEMQLSEQFQNLMKTKTAFYEKLESIAQLYGDAQEKVINELKNWQRNQALAGNGAQFRDNLDRIQTCIEMLFDAVCRILNYWEQYVKYLRLRGPESDISPLLEIMTNLRRYQEELVLSAFIVEKQPPQVMKTNTRFAAAVRWLIGPKLDIHKNNPTVTCVILSESQAQRHSTQRTMNDCSSSSSSPPSSGEIVNNVGTMEYQQQTNVFSASFRNMQLRKIKRAEKKGTESVMDEKFALLFYTATIVNNYEIRAWTLSLPVVVIVHGNQEPQSWATITWDNAFSEIVREPFAVPDKVSWSQLSFALNTKFASATGRPLTQENLNFLHEKLYRNELPCGDHKDYITWAQFCKEPLPDRSFTFWDWFFAIMKVTKDHLLGLWKAGLITGFINKAKVTGEILNTHTPGTFLLRFSDSELGGITVAFVNTEQQVLMLSPWTARDLQIRGLADRIHDLEMLCFIYPSNVARDEAFREYYTQRMEEHARRDGYVANTIRAHVPAIEGSMQNATPQHHMQSPHPHDIPMSNVIADFDAYLYD